MSLDGTIRTEIISPQPISLGLWTARMSPNQEYVAFQKFTSDTDPNQWSLSIYDVEKSAFRHLMDAVWLFRWSPDNRIAVYNWSNGSIYVLTSDGQIEREIKDVSLSNPELMWSPDNQRLALAAQQRDEIEVTDEIEIIEIKTNQRKSVAQGNDLYRWRMITSLAWSPDGKKIAFVSTYERKDGSGATGELFIVNVETDIETRLAGGVGPDEPLWSPDGKRIAFLASEKDTHAEQIHVVDVASGEIKQLTCFEGQKFSLSW